MSASTRSMDRSGRIWLLGLFLCFLFFMAWWLGDPYAAGAALVLGLAATGLAARTPAGLAAFKAALEDMGKRRRDLALKDACRTWDRWGDLAGLAGELFAYNIERREYYRGAVVGIGNPFFLCNAKGSITHASQTLFALLKKPEKEVVNVTVGQAFEDHEGGFFAAEVMARGTATREERELHLWDGRTLPVFLYADCIRDGKNQVIGCVASIVDLSVLKEQQRQLQAHEEQMVRLGQEINGLAQRAASAAEELSASADEQARGAETQKRQTESVATAMEEMRASVLEVARNAGKTSEAAGEANESANAGGGLVGRAVEGIHEVSASAGRLSGVLSQLEEQTGEIGRIIGVINEIADQTNLLALNAAIEAARAGDAGRGFAVVADEVRKLAEKTMTATREVAEAIKKVQTGSNQAQASMQETERRVENSTRLSSEAGTAIRGVTGRIEDMTVRVAQIATAAEEQSVAAEEINRSIEDIARVAGDAEEAADQTAAATRELADLSQQLLTLSRTFQNGG